MQSDKEEPQPKWARHNIAGSASRVGYSSDMTLKLWRVLVILMHVRQSCSDSAAKAVL